MLACSGFAKRPTVITLSLLQTRYLFCPELSLFTSRHTTDRQRRLRRHVTVRNPRVCVCLCLCVGVLVHLCACCSFNSLPSPHTPVAGLDYHLNSETKNSATFLAPKQFLHPLTIAAKHPPPPPFYWCQYLSLLLRLSSKGCVQLTKHQRHAREKRRDVLEGHARHYIIHRPLMLVVLVCFCSFVCRDASIMLRSALSGGAFHHS